MKNLLTRHRPGLAKLGAVAGTITVLTLMATPAFAAARPAVAGPEAPIVNGHVALCVTEIPTGPSIGMRACDGGRSQLWTYDPAAKQIRQTSIAWPNGLCWMATANISTSITTVCNAGSDNQQFTYDPATQEIKTAFGTCVYPVPGQNGILSNGTCTGEPDQQWTSAAFGSSAGVPIANPGVAAAVGIPGLTGLGGTALWLRRRRKATGTAA
jgi:hypothetical protein